MSARPGRQAGDLHDHFDAIAIRAASSASVPGMDGLIGLDPGAETANCTLVNNPI